MTVLLIRHGVSTANQARILAGRKPGVSLNEAGEEQARSLADRLQGLEIAKIVHSPLERCGQTVEPLAAALGVDTIEDERLAEVDYGSWTGSKLGDLTDEPLWQTVQNHPSAAVFPGGESLVHMALRVVSALRERDAALAEEHGRDVLWIACSHGDPIKAAIADACGMHLDAFQRIVVEPASVSAVRYTAHRPFVMRLNDTGSDFALLSASLAAPMAKGTESSDESNVPPGGSVR